MRISVVNLCSLCFRCHVAVFRLSCDADVRSDENEAGGPLAPEGFLARFTFIALSIAITARGFSPSRRITGLGKLPAAMCSLIKTEGSYWQYKNNTDSGNCILLTSRL